MAFNILERIIKEEFDKIIDEGYDDVGIDYIKRQKKLNDYTSYLNKKVLNNVTLLQIDEDMFADDWKVWGKILAFDNEDGTEVGRVSFGRQGDYDRLMASVDVRPDKRRQGIASEMYKWVEELTGETLHPDIPHSNSAGKLWGNPNRKFGIKNDID